MICNWSFSNKLLSYRYFIDSVGMTLWQNSLRPMFEAVTTRMIHATTQVNRHTLHRTFKCRISAGINVICIYSFDSSQNTGVLPDKISQSCHIMGMATVGKVQTMMSFLTWVVAGLQQNMQMANSMVEWNSSKHIICRKFAIRKQKVIEFRL